MGDHTETVEIDFDPALVSFEQLLDVFWSHHRPRKDGYGGRQYMSLVLYRNEKQKNQATFVKNRIEERLKTEIETELKPFDQFFLAEEKHQKYYLKRYKQAYESVLQLFQSHDAFVKSTIAARLNGFVREFGTLGELNEEIQYWGLDDHDIGLLKETINKLKW